MITLRRLGLTDFVLKVSKGIKTHTLEYAVSDLIENRKEIKKFELAKKWAETKMAKKLAAHDKRTKLNDFERFQVMVLKRQVFNFGKR